MAVGEAVVGAAMVADDGLSFVWRSLFSFLRRLLVLFPPSISAASVPAAIVCRSDRGSVDGWLQRRCPESGRSSGQLCPPVWGSNPVESRRGLTEPDGRSRISFSASSRL